MLTEHYLYWNGDVKRPKLHFFLDNNRKKQGEYTEWHRNGRLMSRCFYKDDQKHGEYLEWYYDGAMFKRCFYEYGYLQGNYHTWYSDGTLSDQIFYENGTIHGLYRKWFQNGTPNVHYFFGERREWMMVDFFHIYHFPDSDDSIHINTGFKLVIRRAQNKYRRLILLRKLESLFFLIFDINKLIVTFI